MSIPPDRQAVDALRPCLPWVPPTDEFRLFTGPLRFVPAGGEPLPAAPGHIDLLLRSGQHLDWHVDLDGQDDHLRHAWARRAGARATGVLSFDLHGCPTTLQAHALSTGRGFVAAGRYMLPGAQIDRVVAHIINVPDMRPDVLIGGEGPGGGPLEWHGRRVIDTPPWQLTLDARPDLHDAYHQAKQSYLSVLTHTLSIRRLDGGQFSADEAGQILDDVHIGLSFPLGRWAAPILPVGLAADGNTVASFWGAWHAQTPGIDAERWWPDYEDEFLNDYLPKLLSASQDSAERDHLHFLITSSLATSQNTFLEQRISTALAAIEYLSWVDEVPLLRTEQSWRSDAAHQRIRRRLINARIPLSVDKKKSPNLFAFAKANNVDGPGAITLVRDEVIHPKDRTVLDGPASPLPNAARLASRYLDLLILHRIGYQGRTRDRTKLTGFEGETDPVPWTTTPSGN